MREISTLLLVTWLVAAMPWPATTAHASSETPPESINFTNIADDPASGIDYRRKRPDFFPFIEQVQQQTLVTPLTRSEIDAFLAAQGAPIFAGTPPERFGLALIDYDNDGDIDVFLPNARASDNSLLENQLMETGQATFIDVAAAAGVTGTDLQSTGAAYADIDNDGDLDLFTYGHLETDNILFVNNGDGTFEERRSGQTGIAAGEPFLSVATFGDVNGDSFVDLFLGVSQTEDFPEKFSRNLLFLNNGNLTFTDVSVTSGIQNLFLAPPKITRSQFLTVNRVGGVISLEHWARLLFENETELREQPSSMTWGVGMIDYDMDGDLDLLHVDVQSATRNEAAGGLDIGYVHLFENDGTAHFVDRTRELGLNKATGAWMGWSSADFNRDGQLDFFFTNFGANGGRTRLPMDLNSRWFLSLPDGTYFDTGEQMTQSNAFGWGNSAFDVDNDGDTDVVYSGSLGNGPVSTILSPMVVYEGNGTGSFTPVFDAFDQADHLRRHSSGLATGDLNNDGFKDVVSVSQHLFPQEISLTPAILSDFSAPGPFDEFAFTAEQYNALPGTSPFNPRHQWKGIPLPEGRVAVELNSADNGNRWVSVRVHGSVGLVPGARASRDGIGAILSFKPRRGARVMHPVTGGSSFASQNSLRANFGLGKERKGTLDIFWPGGVRNRLYGVRHGEHVDYHEIPCSFDGDWDDDDDFEDCVEEALEELEDEGLLTKRQAERYEKSMERAFEKAQGDDDD